MAIDRYTLVEDFVVVSERGERLRVVVRQEWIDAGTLDDPHATLPGLKEALLLDGRPLNVLPDGTYEMVETGEVLRRV